jgi:hypothetical protein
MKRHYSTYQAMVNTECCTQALSHMVGPSEVMEEGLGVLYDYIDMSSNFTSMTFPLSFFVPSCTVIYEQDYKILHTSFFMKRGFSRWG